MNKKARFWVFLGFYLLALAAGFLVMALAGLGVSWNVTIAMLLVIFTAFVSYAIAHPGKK